MKTRDRQEIRGSLAGSGKDWQCFANSTKKEIANKNPDLTPKEVDIVYSLIQPIEENEDQTTANT